MRTVYTKRIIDIFFNFVVVSLGLEFVDDGWQFWLSCFIKINTFQESGRVLTLIHCEEELTRDKIICTSLFSNTLISQAKINIGNSGMIIL